MFARRGQLALPAPLDVVPAQLGLDGAAYALSAAYALGSSPEGASPLLGHATPTFLPGTQGPEGEGEAGRSTPDLPDGISPSPAWRRNLEDYERRLRERLNPAEPPRQLRLFLVEEVWEQSPRQTNLWDRLDVRLPLVPERQQKCQRTRYVEAGEVELARGKTGRWRLRGVVACGKYSCPNCGPIKARDVASRLGACFEAHREQHPEGDHWMLTLAVPHQISDGVEQTNAWLYDACARFWLTRAWERFAERWGVEARVRAYDASHGGKNGHHAHFHIALFAERVLVPLATVARLELKELEQQIRRERWARRSRKRNARGMTTDAERADDAAWDLEVGHRLLEARALYEVAWAEVKVGDVERMPLRDCSQGVRAAFLRDLAGGLFAAWRASLRAVGCPHEVGSYALDLLPAERAEAYFVKWGLAEEVGLSVEKDRSHLRLLDVVAARLGEPSDIAADLYHDFNQAMRGRTWVTGLKAACAHLGVTDEDAREYVARMRERRNAELARAGEPPLAELPELLLRVRPWLWSAFLALGHAEVFSWLDEQAAAIAAEDLSPLQPALDEFLRRGRCDTS